MGFFKKAAEKIAEDKKMSLKRRKRLIGFISIITLLSMTTSTVAWFTVNTMVGVDNLDLHISVSAQLKIAMEDYGRDLSRYKKVINKDDINSYLRSHNVDEMDRQLLDPVTTRNGTVFTNRGGTERTPNNRSYLEFECYMIATEPMWVHLTTEGAENVEGNDGTRVTTDSPAPQSDVVRCTRVGFETSTDGIAIYEPNRGTPVNGQNTFDLPSGTMVYSNSTRLFHLDELSPKKVTVRVWIDGEDPECDDDVQDADLKIELGFIGTDDANVPIS